MPCVKIKMSAIVLEEAAALFAECDDEFDALYLSGKTDATGEDLLVLAHRCRDMAKRCARQAEIERGDS